MSDHINEKKTQEFLKLLTRSQNAIFSYILTLVPNKTNAENVYQETVSVLWEKFDQYKPNTEFRVWACVVAKYKVFEYIRKNQNSKIQFNSETVELLELTSNRTNEHIEERLDALRKCIKKLPSRNLRILKMRYENDWSVKKISGIIEQTVQSVYKQLNKMHLMLLACIEETLQS